MTLLLLALNTAMAALIVVLSATVASRRRTERSTVDGRRTPAIQELLTGIQSNDEAIVVAAACRVLDDLAKYEATLVSLIDRVRHAPPYARLAILAAIRAILRSRPAFGRFCWPDGDADVRAAIVAALTEAPTDSVDLLGLPSAADIIEAATNDPESVVRRAAVSNLSVMPIERALPIIWRALDDVDEEVEQSASAALVGRLDPRAIARIVDYLARAPRARARWMLEALARMNSSVVDPFVQLVMEGQGGVKSQVAGLRALGAVGLPATCSELVRLLHHVNPVIRRAAATTIAEIARLVAGRGLDPGVVRSMALQLSRETHAAVTLALLDGLEACGDADGGRAIAERLPALPAALRERGLEAIAALQRRPTGPSTVHMAEA